MRIRKHAKISSLQYASSSSSSSSSLKPPIILRCQLNQSPWDVITFSHSPPSSPPPPPSQEKGSDARAGNASSDYRVSAARVLSRWPRSEPDAAHNSPPPPVEDKASILCCKTDGKSWKCPREAVDGNSLCSHHLSMGKSYSSFGHNVTKKSVKAEAEAPLRSRPKRNPAASSSKSSKFYLYSWGKQIGKIRKNNIVSNMPKNVQVDEPVVISQIGSEEFDYAEYEDDEDDEEEEESRNSGKKRVRRPIKARSLKSIL